MADLAPIPLPQRRAIEFGFPFKNPYTVFGKTALFIINWLDSWSGPCNGPTFSPGAAPGYQTTPFNANDPILSCTMTPGWLTPHPLEFNGTQLRSQIEGRAKLGPPLNRFGFEATLRCAWNSPPAPPDWQFRSNVWKVRAGQAGYDVSLFSTAADENGNAQLYLRGRLTSTPIRTVDNDRITMEHTVSLLLISDKGARAELLLFHGQAGDSKADVDIKADFTNIGPLAPNANYRLTVQISTTVVFPYICGDPPPLCSCGTFGQTAAR